MSQYALIRKIYSDEIKAENLEIKNVSEDIALDTIKQHLKRREKNLFQFLEIDNAEFDYEEYSDLIEFLYYYQTKENDNILLKLKKPGIDTIIEHESNPEGFNSNKYSNEIKKFKEKLIKEFLLDEINKKVEERADKDAEIQILFWKKLYYALEMKKKIDLSELLKRLTDLKIQMEKDSNFKIYDEFSFQELMLIKLKAHEFKSRFIEEEYIQEKLRKSYKETFLNNTYYSRNRITNIKKVKKQIDEIIKLTCGNSYSIDEYKDKIKDFINKDFLKCVFYIVDVYNERISPEHNYKATTTYSEYDFSKRDFTLMEVISILREFVILKGNYIPLRGSKSKEISTDQIFRKLKNEKTSSESYDFYIYLKMNRGIAREKRLSKYLPILHEIEIEFNAIIEKLLSSFNSDTREFYYKELEDIFTLYLEEYSIDLLDNKELINKMTDSQKTKLLFKVQEENISKIVNSKPKSVFETAINSSNRV